MYVLSSRDKRYINLALKVAEQSTQRYRLGAVIYKNGSVISAKVNVKKNDPNFAPHKHSSVHAECAAIRAVVSPSKRGAVEGSCNGAVIYVARIGNTNKPLLAKPCVNCMPIIKAAGIKKIVWTNINGTIESCRV